jgi:hypothetical protein
MSSTVIAQIAKKLRQHYDDGVAEYESYEIGNKKSLFLINPTTNSLFYIDKFGRPLLEHERTALQDLLPSNVRIVDISREQSKENIYSAGFHHNQPVPDDQQWLAHATKTIIDYAAKLVAQPEVSQDQISIAARFQKPAAHNLFKMFKKPVSAEKENALPQEAPSAKTKSRTPNQS